MSETSAGTSLGVRSERPTITLIVSTTRVQFSMQANGRKRPVASANPSTSPNSSQVGCSLTAKAVPLVPKLIVAVVLIGGSTLRCWRETAPPAWRRAFQHDAETPLEWSLRFLERGEAAGGMG